MGGTFELSDIPPAPRGVPQIDVSFEVDTNGILQVTAEEKSSGKTEKIEIKNDSGRLTQDQIDKLINEAEEFKAEDELLRKKIDTRNKLENFVYTVTNELKEKEGKITDEEYNKIKVLLDDTNDWLDDNSHNAEDYEEKFEELKTATTFL